ncbi:MAG TPA: phenylacetic acid degradation b [Ohtaekwangia sp.]|nr:phenylacetic acid degradation b [Ohtaekwangia sp.]
MKKKIIAQSLDPRVTRLPEPPPQPLDGEKPPGQFGTFEVFVQPREGKAFQHEGIVHAPDLELAYVLAKETFTRRFTCHSLYVVETGKIFVSPMTENQQSAYDALPPETPEGQNKISYEIYHLYKRGKQHVHVATLSASSPVNALHEAKREINGEKLIYNLWAIATRDIRFTRPEEQDLWLTLPEKKFRDASDYKGGDKLKSFLEKNTPSPAS